MIILFFIRHCIKKKYTILIQVLRSWIISRLWTEWNHRTNIYLDNIKLLILINYVLPVMYSTLYNLLKHYKDNKIAMIYIIYTMLKFLYIYAHTYVLMLWKQLPFYYISVQITCNQYTMTHQDTAQLICTHKYPRLHTYLTCY